MTRFKNGDRVVHGELGYGTVKHTGRDSAGIYAEVRFDEPVRWSSDPRADLRVERVHPADLTEIEAGTEVDW